MYAQVQSQVCRIDRRRRFVLETDRRLIIVFTKERFTFLGEDRGEVCVEQGRRFVLTTRKYMYSDV